MGIALTRSGVLLDGEEVPLLAGAMHYWRIEPRFWRRGLESLRAMGCRLVDVYVPWGVHEVAPGRLELGASDARLDVAGFLRLAHEVGLLAIVRPGPHINAELTYFGLPERIVWDPRCQARSPRGNPVVLPFPPRMFPVPSYASEAYRDEVSRYFELLGAVLAPLCWPRGPIVLLQVDNEGALYFRDGAYDQDYHPDALAGYRSFLRAKYETVGALAAAYGSELTLDVPGGADGAVGGAAPATSDVALSFSTIEPPTTFDAETPTGLVRHLDWVEFQEQLLADTFARFRGALVAGGLGGIPTVHNFPLAQEATPLNAARILGAVDMVGLDYYGKATPAAHRDIARRTGELATHGEHAGFPPFACEMGAGFPPVFPPLAERDSLFTAMCALAYGLRGLNLYMGVDRDRWVGAPIDSEGRPRAFADSWQRLFAALEATAFHRLRRRVPVRLLIPRMERRLARVAHAFGPVSAALLAVMGKGTREACLEDQLGLGYPVALETEGFLRSFEEALEARGIPHALVGGELRGAALLGARWIVCGTSGAMSTDLLGDLRNAVDSGVRLTVGPREPRFDGAWRDVAPQLSEAHILRMHDPATVDALVARVASDMGLPSFACDPSFVHAAVHEDESGDARVLFVVNPTEHDTTARVTTGFDGPLVDVVSGESFRTERHMLELRVRGQTVRMLRRA